MKTYVYLFLLTLIVFLFNSCDSDGNSDSNLEVFPGTAGIGGSMARFAISGHHLYTVTNTNLKVYDINEPENPKPSADIKIGVQIETIFPYGGNMFIGSQTGMHIYSTQNPHQPAHISTYTHVQSCDPVVVQGNLAYVTLREGNDCRNGQNLLDVIDITNLAKPQVIRSYPLSNPHGLGIDGNTLFVCEGVFGLKVFDATEPQNLIQLYSIPDIHTYDVIPRNKVLLVVGEDGLYQYNYSNPKQLHLLSTIPIGK